MQLKIKGKEQNFIPIQRFRELWGLPESFRVALFEAKDWTDLGSLERAGDSLLVIKHQVIQAVAAEIALPDILPAVETLAVVFRRELEAANMAIGLREVEVDFAVSGFQDILQAVAYALLQLAYGQRHEPAQICRAFDFLAIYQTWLNDSVRVSGTPHLYEHQGLKFETRVVYYAYGRVGLQIAVDDQVYYVLDMSLACPAASYMRDLCSEMAEVICRALANK
jgi:hypothetical protein